MNFKPRQTHWFETNVPRDLIVYAIEALAQTGAVELSHGIWATKTRDTSYIKSRLDDFTDLARKFEKDLPTSLFPPETHAESPEHLAENALKTLRKWSAGLLKLQRELKRTHKEFDELQQLMALLSAIPDHDIDFSWVEEKTKVLYKKLFACPHGKFNHPFGSDIVVEIFPADKQDFILVLATPDHSQILEAATTLFDCNEIIIPGWLSRESSNRLEKITQRMNALKEIQNKLETRLLAHKDSHEIKASLASVRLLNWYLENSFVSSDDEKLCHIIGWTSAESANELEDALHMAGIKAAVLFSEKPVVLNPPVHFQHPWWIRPFSFFVNLMGAPGSDEIDPTPLLALIVPLLFGYMFPDVGHGLVLVIVGIIGHKRIPETRLLIPCGLAATGFGMMFGDVFGRHDIIEAIWIKPLENPLLVLIVPLVMGALLITTGLIFSGIEAHWRGEVKRWFQTDASVLMLYLVLILGIFWLPALWLLAPVIFWYFVGTVIGCNNNTLTCLINGLGHLLESALRLVLNSISFVRVGAFALAHTGTTHAANLIAGMIDNIFLVIIFYILSHVFIIVLEGLIVFVQTSRLILFEFFIRFLKADGRVFKPMHGLIK